MRQVLSENNAARHFIVRQTHSRKLDQLLFRGGHAALLKNDVRLRKFVAQPIGHANNAHLPNRGILIQHSFDFDGRYQAGLMLYDLGLATHEPVKILSVFIREVAGVKPSVPYVPGCQFRITPVTCGHTASADNHLTDFTSSRDRVARIVD